jgi:hypothetical protein
MPEATPLILGDYGPGAYGPTIVLKLASPAAAGWLRDLLLARAAGREPLDLVSQPDVQITNVEALVLRTVPAADGRCRLYRAGESSRFTWECTSDGWRALAFLIEPFVAGERGHQYLTSEHADDALIEVSHDEPNVVIPPARRPRPITTVEPPSASARAWVKDSLRQGRQISAAVLAAEPVERGRFRAFVQVGTPPSKVERYRTGGVVRRQSVTDMLGGVLDDLAPRGARCVLIEDPFAKRSDPWLERFDDIVAFIGDDVLSWCDLAAGGGRAAADKIARDSHGYPTNAFVVATACREFGLANREQAAEDLPDKAVESLLAVVVAAYDAESFLIWDAP